MIQFLQKRWVYHSLIWVTLYLTFAALIFFSKENTLSILECLREPFFSIAPIFLCTYLGFFAKERFFDARQYLIYLLSVVAIVAICVMVYETLDMLDGERGNSRTQNITNFVFVQLFAVGLQYFKRGITNQYQLQELRAKTAISELNALKAQINPHFLFNTLNNIYSMNQIDPEKGSEMIMELSDVMRYHLEFSKEQKVKLEEEIQLLRSYIKLEQLRLRDTCDVKIDFDEVDDSLMIHPLFFIPFVENAFKHGTHPTKKCFVHIELRTTATAILFTVKNSIIANRKVVKTNIGLQNTKRRLELILPDKHQLNIKQNERNHSVELKIEL